LFVRFRGPPCEIVEVVKLVSKIHVFSYYLRSVITPQLRNLLITCLNEVIAVVIKKNLIQGIIN